MTEKAAVLCPEGSEVDALSLEHCEAGGYHIASVVHTWQAALDLLVADLVQVIVVASRETWTPRIEFAERRSPRIISTAGTSNTRWRRARVVRRYN